MSNVLADEATAHTWQFSVRHLLITLGLAGLVLAPVHYFGGVYLFSAVCSMALILICAATYRVTAIGAVGIAFLAVFVGVVLAVVIFTFLVHAFFNLVACVVLAVARVRVRAFATVLCLTMFAVYAFAIYSGFAEMRKLAGLKAIFPFKSLSDRLAFENQNPPSNPVQLNPVVDKNLDEQDNRLDRRYWISRAWVLEQLHEHTTEQFSRAAGFGLMRLPSIRTEIVQLEPRTPLRMPAGVDASPPFQSLHQSAVRNFVDPERLGYIRSRSEISGFESHGLSSLDTSGAEKSAASPNWQVTRLELVSLLRHREPRVYVAKSMPDMDKLADVPTRPLNSFEEKSLPQLLAQTDVVTDQKPDHIQMLGSLRAGKTCLECHTGNRGKLLGAFSYELRPIASNERKAAATELDSSGRN